MATPARAALVLFAAALAPFGGRAAPALRQASASGDGRDVVVLSGSVLVPRGASAGTVVVLHGRARVEGVVREDVVVLDGRAVVLGQVSGSVVAVLGDVALGPGAQVGGDVLAGGAVLAEGDAAVGGRVRQGVAFVLRWPGRALGRFLPWAAVSVSTLLLALLALALAPRAADAVAEAARTAPWASAAWGALLVASVPAVGILLVASVLGLPAGLALLLGLALLSSVGYAGTAWAVGRLLVRPPRSRVLALLAGWGVTRAVALVPALGAPTWIIGAAFGVGALAV
ncbi:MAG TPA: hypothetical protein VNO79_01615, partial [Actinomycetota bacterium]|nr:hypothetical protein [Actinomycetota bacterium]